MSVTGGPGNSDSYEAAVSRTGRYVAFISGATNLVEGPRRPKGGVFVRDMVAGTTERVSLNTADEPVDARAAWSEIVSISYSGRFVAFSGRASRFVTGDRNHVQDVFVRDRQLGTTELVSVGNRGQQGNEHSGVARISGNGHVVCFLTLASTIAGPRVRPSVARVVVRDLGRERTRLVAPRSSNCALSRTGRLVAFESKARLVRRDQDRTTDVYVRDMRSGRFHLISGGGPDKFRGGSDEPALSRSGRFVAFTTRNARVPSDTNRVADVYVRDLQTGRLIRASIATGGEQGKRPSVRPSISGDGRFVTFTTYNGFEPIDGEGQDAYVRDLQKRTTRLVSVSTTGEAGSSYSSWISADGTSVAFASGTDSVVPEDTNMLIDVFIRRGIR